MDISILEDLGLTNSEIKTYIALLELGSSGATEILHKAGIQSSVMYRALNSLIDKGLIGFILNGNNKIYKATDPENFFDFIEDKKKRFESILPELKEKQSYAKTEEKATIYKGKNGITKVYNLLLNSSPKEYLSFGGGKECLELMGDKWWSLIHKKRLGKQIIARQVWDNTVKEFLKHDFMQTSLTKVKFIDEKFANFQETIICGNFVAITIFTENPYSILIEDSIVTEGYKKYFELLWEKGE